MQTIWASKGVTDGLSSAGIRKAVSLWMNGRKRGHKIADGFDVGYSEIFDDDSYFECEGSDAAGTQQAIIYVDKDSKSGMSWRTEVRSKDEDGRCRWQISVSLGRLRPGVNQPSFRRPRVIEHLDSSQNYFECNSIESGEAIAREIFWEERERTIVVFSTRDEKPLVDARAIADDLRGTAVVFVVSDECATALRRKAAELGASKGDSERSAPYGGAAKIYVPGMRATDSFASARIILPTDIEEAAAKRAIQEFVFKAACRATTYDLPDISEIRNLNLFRSGGTSAEARKLIDSLNADKSKLNDTIEALQEELLRARASAPGAPEANALVRQEHIDEDAQQQERSNRPTVLFAKHGSNRPALDFAESQSPQYRSDVIRKLYEAHELIAAKPGTAEKVRSNLYEYRVDIPTHWLRFFFSKDRDGNIVFVSGYQKKSNQLKNSEIDRAEEISKKYLGSY